MSENATDGFCSEVLRYVGADRTATGRNLDANLARQEEPGEDLSDLLVTRGPKERVLCTSFDTRL